ncbi:MAG: hypothetical protein IRZ16_18470 [Myxococcaceae bacterium]|nr:hypothetical protein [Myxococcaceae bacterium]
MEVTDGAGNTTVKESTFLLDVAGPEVAISDVTPCSAPNWCPDHRNDRLFEVSATDTAGVGSISLSTPAGTYSAMTTPATFLVPFNAEGDFTLTATAVDLLGNPSLDPANLTASIDFTPPVFSDQQEYEDTYWQNWEHFRFCLTDASPVNFVTPSIFVDGVPTPNLPWASSMAPGCWQASVSGLSLGSHTFELHAWDKWGNESVWSDSFTLTPIPPQLQAPTVTVSQTSPGTATVTTSYRAGVGIQRVVLSLCTSGCNAAQTFFPSSSEADQTGHVFTLTGLTPGHTYFVRVSVTANNQLTTTKDSSPFTIPNPPSSDVVFQEIEPNNSWNVANVVSSAYNVIRGSQSGVELTTDYFKVYFPPGKTLRLDIVNTSGTQCSGGIIEGVYSPFTGQVEDTPWMEELKPSRTNLTYAGLVSSGCPANSDPSYCYLLVRTYIYAPCAFTYDIVEKLEPY